MGVGVRGGPSFPRPSPHNIYMLSTLDIPTSSTLVFSLLLSSPYLAIPRSRSRPAVQVCNPLDDGLGSATTAFPASKQPYLLTTANRKRPGWPSPPNPTSRARPPLLVLVFVTKLLGRRPAGPLDVAVDSVAPEVTLLASPPAAQTLPFPRDRPARARNNVTRHPYL